MKALLVSPVTQEKHVGLETRSEGHGKEGPASPFGIVDSRVVHAAGLAIAFRGHEHANAVEESYYSALDELYAPVAYYRRIMRFLEYYKPISIHRGKTTLLKSIMGAIVFPGILDNGRRHFWALFMTVVQNYRGSLPKIMNHSILGYHIRMKLAEKKVHGGIH